MRVATTTRCTRNKNWAKPNNPSRQNNCLMAGDCPQYDMTISTQNPQIATTAFQHKWRVKWDLFCCQHMKQCMCGSLITNGEQCQAQEYLLVDDLEGVHGCRVHSGSLIINELANRHSASRSKVALSIVPRMSVQLDHGCGAIILGTFHQ